jgi:DNA mismatch endonuclease (patch repair protein)
MDTFSKAKRSDIMSKVRSSHTKPELLVRKYLFKKGFRFSLHRKNLPGTPDIVLRKYKTVIFVNGCFWHGHINCSKSSLPKTRIEFWKNKIERNTERDILNTQKLICFGWQVITIYQCELKLRDIDQTMSKVLMKLNKQALINNPPNFGK